MIMDAKNFQQQKALSSHICIIGGGVAGITLAMELHKKQIPAIMIEAGGESFSMESQSIYAPEKVPSGYEDTTYNRLRFLGGSSNHWQNSTAVFSQLDFEYRPWIENSGWPINLSDLAPYYPDAGYYCGTEKDGYDPTYWENLMPVESPIDSGTGVMLAINKGANPPTRFYHSYGKTLDKSDYITVIKNANFIDATFDFESAKITDISFKTIEKELTHSITASQFVLCCGGIENARLLLTLNEKYSNKIGNQSGNVGRYFMEHPVVRAANFYPNKEKDFSIFTEGKSEETRNIKGFMQLSDGTLQKHHAINLRLPLHSRTNYDLSEGIRSYHYMSNDSRKDWFPDDGWTHIYNILSDLDMFIEGLSRKKFDTKLFDHADEFGGYEIAMMFEQLPNRENKVYLGTDTDELGLKRVNIDWKLSNKDKENIWHSLEILANELGKSDLGRLNILDEYESQVFGEKMFFSHHHMGTTRMAETTENGVVDKNLKVFGTENLYVAGSSVFTTSSHVPPTLTIAALSVRLASYLGDIR